MPIPNEDEDEDEEQQRGHEAPCLGCDLSKQLAPVQNSCADDWRQRGYFWMSFEVIAALNADLYMFTRVGP
jgi:hypothetical protein